MLGFDICLYVCLYTCRYTDTAVPSDNSESKAQFMKLSMDERQAAFVRYGVIIEMTVTPSIISSIAASSQQPAAGSQRPAASSSGSSPSSSSLP